MNEHMDYRLYLDAATKASDRSRSVLFLLAMLAVGVLAAFWNYCPGNWVDAKIHAASAAKAYLAGTPKQSERDAQLGRAVASATKVTDPQVFDEHLRELRKVKLGQNTITIPLASVSFNINDMGLFACLAIVLVLLVLRHCLAREAANLRHAFEAAPRGCLRECYVLLSMSQVLATPPSITDTPARRNRTFVPLIAAAPIVVASVIVVWDALTLSNGWLLSPVRAVVCFGGELGCLAVAIAEWRACSGEIQATTETWARYAADAKSDTGSKHDLAEEPVPDGVCTT